MSVFRCLLMTGLGLWFTLGNLDLVSAQVVSSESDPSSLPTPSASINSSVSLELQNLTPEGKKPATLLPPNALAASPNSASVRTLHLYPEVRQPKGTQAIALERVIQLATPSDKKEPAAPGGAVPALSQLTPRPDGVLAPQVDGDSTSPPPASPGPAPRYLDPNPNPLQFPTRPEEVRVQGTQPITLEQAIELARRNNRNLQVAELQLRRSRAALREAIAEEYPTLDLINSLTRQQSASGEISAQQRSDLDDLFGGSDNNNEITTSYNGSLQLQYDVYTSGGRRARIRAAERQVRSDELELETTLEQLRLDVTNDYYDLQQSDEQVRINAQAVRQAEISLRDAQALERAGLGTRFDVLRAQVQLANSLQDLVNSRSQQLITRRQLVQRLSLAQTINIAAADPVQIAGGWELGLEESIVLAYRNRAELEQLLAQREISEQQRRAALATLGPTVTLAAEYNLLDVFDDDVGTADGYSLSAQARWRLFDGGQARARARQEEANIAIAETRFAEQRDAIRFQVEQAYSTLLANRENVDTARIALEQAREALRLARLRFQAGVGTQSDVINAETDSTRAEGNLVQAILGYNRALASLQRSISNLPNAQVSTATPQPSR